MTKTTKTKEKKGKAMRRRRKRISPFKIVLIVLVAIIAINIGARYIISESHYEHNLEAAMEIGSSSFVGAGYINSSTVLTNLKYSLNNNTDNYSIIKATYNALVYLKNEKGLYDGVVNKNILPDIAKYYDLYAQLGFGHLGINPLAVSWYFKSLGLNAKIAFDMENITTNLNSSDVGIFFYTDWSSHEFRTAISTGPTGLSLFGPGNNHSLNYFFNTLYPDGFIAMITINAEQ